MILYWLLERVAEVALRWYYADVIVQGRARMPAHGPVLLVANHPNALVDAMVVVTAVRRRVLLTAKATLFERAPLAVLLHSIGVIPLRRAKDERESTTTTSDARARNSASFRFVTEALTKGRVVLVFPEGISHDAPALAPLKTGAARMALNTAAAGVRGLRVVPVGLIYERKERRRSRVLVRLGEPLDVDTWLASGSARDSTALTAAIDAGLRQVTLNFASEDRARRALDLGRVLATLAAGVPSLAHPRELALEADLALRIDAASEALADAPASLVHQADALTTRVALLERRLAERHVTLTDLRISPLARHGVRFVLREVAVTTLALPVALLGRLAHWLPLRLARAIATGALADDPSRDQPAMRTILLGAGALVLWYLALGVLLARWFGVGVALLGLLSILFAARVDVLLRDRMRRAKQRARSYLALRADPAWRDEALSEAEQVLVEARVLEQALTRR
jgi:glycerol-3-phosphate O-acyltransferase / dihydroxyacetone phosphate acyltransferase